MQPLTSTERIFLHLERPGYPIDVVGISVLADAPPKTAAMPELRRRVEHAVTTTPFLRRRISSAPLRIGEDRWLELATVDVDAHLHQLTCPAPGDDRALLDLVLELTRAPLDRSRPLWEAWYVDGLDDDRAAVVLRGHHALTDGAGFMALHRLVFDPTDTADGSHGGGRSCGAAAAGSATTGSTTTAPDPAGREEHPPPTRDDLELPRAVRAMTEVPERLVLNTVTGARIAAGLAAAAPGLLTRSLSAAARTLTDTHDGRQTVDAAKTTETVGAPAARPRRRLPRFVPSFTDHPPMTRFNRHVTDPAPAMAVASLPLADVTRARAVVPGATLNDVVLALVGGSLRAYLADRGELPAGPLVTTMPVDVRRRPGRETSDDGGNAFTAVWVELPVHLDDPVARLAAVHAASSRAKGGLRGSRAAWDVLADVGSLVPPAGVEAAMAFAGSWAFQAVPPTLNLSVSTLRGPGPLSLLGSPVEHFHARTLLCPPVHLFVHAITYGEWLEMGVLSVRELLPDPDTVADGLRRELATLTAGAPPPAPPDSLPA